MTKWRPDGWKNPYDVPLVMMDDIMQANKGGYEAGADKMLEAILERGYELLKADGDDICPECGEPRPDDDRVKSGMKCRFCAYGG